MLPVNEMNQLYLATNPDVGRKIRAEYRKAHPAVIVMAIKPKYAKAIYEGRKNWEFRKAPPPIYKEIYIYESAPVSKITGRVVFDMSVTGLRLDVWGIVERCRTLYGMPGINQDDFLEYAGMHDVTALHVYKAKRLEQEVTFGAKPPQNWGRFAATYRDTPKREEEAQ